MSGTRRRNGYYVDPSLGAAGEAIGGAITGAFGGDPDGQSLIASRAAAAGLAQARTATEGVERQIKEEQLGGIRGGADMLGSGRLVPTGTVPAPDDRGTYTLGQLQAQAWRAGGGTNASYLNATDGVNRSLVFADPRSTPEQRDNAFRGAGGAYSGTQGAFRENLRSEEGRNKYRVDVGSSDNRYNTNVQAQTSITTTGMREEGADRRMTASVPAGGALVAPEGSPLFRPRPGQPAPRPVGMPGDYDGPGASTAPIGTRSPEAWDRWGTRTKQALDPRSPTYIADVERVNNAVLQGKTGTNRPQPAPGDNRPHPRSLVSGGAPAAAPIGPTTFGAPNQPQDPAPAPAAPSDTGVLRIIPAQGGNPAIIQGPDRPQTRSNAEATFAGIVADPIASPEDKAAAQAGLDALKAPRSRIVPPAKPATPATVSPGVIKAIGEELDAELSAKGFGLDDAARRWVATRASELFQQQGETNRNPTTAVRNALTEFRAAGEVRSDSSWNPLSGKTYGLPSSLVPGGGTTQPPAQTAPGAPPAAPPQAAGLIEEARAAIARGAPRDAVISRLRDMGVNPEGL